MLTTHLHLVPRLRTSGAIPLLHTPVYFYGVGRIHFTIFNIFQIPHTSVLSLLLLGNYRICSRNLRTFFSILAAEKSGCVKYADFFVEVLIWVLF